MNNTYLEVLNTLKYTLKELENNWWHKNIEKSIDKYNQNKDVSYFIYIFTGRGFDDAGPMKYEITNALVSLAYTIATKIKNNEKYDFRTILFEKLVFYNNKIQYVNNNKPYLSWENELEKAKDSSAYISYLIGNYQNGNLMKITQNYLMPQTFARRK